MTISPTLELDLKTVSAQAGLVDRLSGRLAIVVMAWVLDHGVSFENAAEVGVRAMPILRSVATGSIPATAAILIEIGPSGTAQAFDKIDEANAAGVRSGCPHVTLDLGSLFSSLAQMFQPVAGHVAH